MSGEADVRRAQLSAAKRELMMRRLRGEAGGAGPTILRAPRSGPLPLSFNQERLWFLDRLGLGSAYNMGQVVRLRGVLDVDALQQALDAVVARHEVLRTGYPEMGGEPILERVMSAVAAALDGSPYRFEGQDRVPCFLLEEDNDLYRDLSAMLGQSETLSASYGTDAGWLQQGGFDCLVWAPGSIEVAHRANEVMPRDEFARGGELLGRVVERFCGAG